MGLKIAESFCIIYDCHNGHWEPDEEFHNANAYFAKRHDLSRYLLGSETIRIELKMEKGNEARAHFSFAENLNTKCITQRVYPDKWSIPYNIAYVSPEEQIIPSTAYQSSL